jgi:hypothetical protein
VTKWRLSRFNRPVSVCETRFFGDIIWSKSTQVNTPPQKAPSVNSGWLAIGVGVGTAIGAATDNLAIGVALGTAFGLLAPSMFSNRDE